MVVRIRFGRGQAFEHLSRRNGRAARLAASVLTLIAICLACFGGWRIAEDLGWADAFIVSDGLFSHWQVWIAGAVAVQWAAWKLLSYARSTEPETELTPSVS